MIIGKMSHQLPGMTENFGNPFQSVMPFINASKLVGLKDRKVVLLATATITQKNIFSNGLFQNVYIIYTYPSFRICFLKRNLSK